MKHDNQLLRTLVRQHREIDDMLERLKTGDDETRRMFFPQMRVDLLAHAKAEEKTFYAALEQAGEKKDAKHAKREHREIEDALRQLDALELTDDRWPEGLARLADTVRHHVEEEESEIFDAAVESMDEAELDEIATRFEEQRSHELAALGVEDDYEQRTKDELMELAREHEVDGRSTMTKQELIVALRVMG